ncbi:MAG: GAF domain-containing protein [Verrucomicrobiota bacterium]
MKSPYRIPEWRARDLRSLLNPDKMLQMFLEEAIETLGGNRGSIRLTNPNSGTLDVEASVGLTSKSRKVDLKIGEGVTGYVAGTGRFLRIDDVKKDRRYIDLSPKTRSELAVPIEIDRVVVGVLNVESDRVNAFDLQSEKYLGALSKEVASFLEIGWEIKRLKTSERQLSSVIEIGQTIFSMQSMDEALSQTTLLVGRLMKSKLCSLMLLSADGTELELRASSGAGTAYQSKPNIPVDESLMGFVLKRGKPLTVMNVQDHDSFLYPRIAKKEGLVSFLAVPLIVDEVKIGVLSVYMPVVHRFSVAETELLTTLGNLVASAIERGRLLEKLISLEESLRQGERLSAVGMMAAEIAHEIRNPLTVVQMLFHHLTESAPFDPAVQKDIQVITEKMKSMNRIVDQVLTFSRSSEPQFALLDPSRIFQDVLLLTRHKLESLRIRMTYHVEEGLAPMNADRAQVDQALLNLILNASDAMDEEGTLRLQAHNTEFEGVRYLALTVSDTGHGMTPEVVDRLFTSFLSSKTHGTGIGLAIVRKIMENHRGKIRVTSKKGKGSQFQLLFPVFEG